MSRFLRQFIICFFVGLYFPPLALVLLPILLKASAIWLTEKNLETALGLLYLAFIHFVAIAFRWILSHLELILPTDFQMTPTAFANLVFGMALAQFVFIAVLLRSQRRDVVNAVYCFVLLELGVALYTLGLFNPSLVFLVGIVSVPLLTFFFIFQPSNRFFVFLATCALLAVGVSYTAAVHMDSFVVPTISKYFYESQVFGNFLFDVSFVFLFPVFSCILALV